MQNAQRQHIVHSFDSLLYQLHALSFFLSPSIWALLCRILSQIQCSKSRIIDPNRSLRFWFITVLLFNAPSLFNHVRDGPTSGRTAVLDFIGMAYVPPKTQLLLLDVFIIFLQMLLTTISWAAASNSTQDSLLSPSLALPPSSRPSPPPLATPLLGPFSSKSAFSYPPPPPPSPPPSISPYVLDLRWAPILTQLRNPTPPPTSSPLLPAPNTMPVSAWGMPVPPSLGMLLRARAQVRSTQNAGTSPAASGDATAGMVGPVAVGMGSRGIPGAMDVDEDGD